MFLGILPALASEEYRDEKSIPVQQLAIKQKQKMSAVQYYNTGISLFQQAHTRRKELEELERVKSLEKKSSVEMMNACSTSRDYRFLLETIKSEEASAKEKQLKELEEIKNLERTFFENMLKAAEGKYGDAYSMLFLCYREGIGVDINFDESKKYANLRIDYVMFLNKKIQ